MLQKIPMTSKNISNKNCSLLNFLQKNPVDAYLYLPQEWSQKAPKINHFLNILQCTGMGQYVHFGTERYQKYQLYWKMLQTKII